MFCLANSKRPGGRCIAGLRLPELTWLRPVTEIGSLEVAACRGFLPLDIVELTLAGPRPEVGQPENWLLAGSTVKHVRGTKPTEAYGYMRHALIPGPALFGNREPYLIESSLTLGWPASSLGVIEPDDLKWRIDLRPNTSWRAEFSLHGERYDLPVTDPIWRDRMSAVLGPGGKAQGGLGGAAGDRV